jgi:hypothetical protein
VTVGETLTEARNHAGLSVDELSERTRIRGTVIRSIEQDDFETCGGDLFVRGYVRAIAGAVGIDAQPLIREYDLGRAGPNGSTGRDAKGFPAVPAPDAALTAFDLPAVTDAPAEGTAGHHGPADLGATRFDLLAVSTDPAATMYDLPRVPETPVVPEDLMAAGYDLRPAEPAEVDSATRIMPSPDLDPAGPQEPAGPPASLPADTAQPGRARRKRRVLFAAGAALVVLIAAGALGISLATGNTVRKNTAATTVPQPAALSAAKASAAAKKRASAAAQAGAAAARASASAAAEARQAATKAGAQRVITLPVLSAAAYGPDGFTDGDVPGSAKNAIARDPSQPWTTQWYATPTFGMLKHGTGLLLDLGGKVTVTSIRLDLAQYQGTDLQIRVGNDTASPQDLRVAATANNVTGVINLTLRDAVAARYLLIWVTQLPLDGSGHYQASVSHVVVTGRR